MKAIELYFPVVLFNMLYNDQLCPKMKQKYKVFSSFEYADEILKLDHSNESFRAVFSCYAV